MEVEGKGKVDGKVNCFDCVHFYITWDKSFPRGCRALSFKGREMPSVTVLSSSGMECQRFTPRESERCRGPHGGSGA